MAYYSVQSVSRKGLKREVSPTALSCAMTLTMSAVANVVLSVVTVVVAMIVGEAVAMAVADEVVVADEEDVVVKVEEVEAVEPKLELKAMTLKDKAKIFQLLDISNLDPKTLSNRHLKIEVSINLLILGPCVIFSNPL